MRTAMTRTQRSRSWSAESSFPIRFPIASSSTSYSSWFAIASSSTSSSSSSSSSSSLHMILQYCNNYQLTPRSGYWRFCVQRNQTLQFFWIISPPVWLKLFFNTFLAVHHHLQPVLHTKAFNWISRSCQVDFHSISNMVVENLWILSLSRKIIQKAYFSSKELATWMFRKILCNCWT